jgi:hypothetical protein
VKTFEALKLWNDTPTRLLEMQKPEHQGDADLTCRTRPAGLWLVAGIEFTEFPLSRAAHTAGGAAVAREERGLCGPRMPDGLG